jgi:thiamine-monophosphate kinase
VSHLTEIERIARLAARFGGQTGEGIERAIGDDAAVLAPREARGKVVWTIDAQVEGVHFRADLASWNDVGWRSFMAAASDLGAMGASPWCALSSLVLPAGFDDAAFEAIGAGQAEAARTVGAPIVGGNLSRGDAVSITTTLLGTAPRPLARAAQVGDAIWIAGPVGLAAAGLAALERKMDPSDPAVARAVLAWRRPVARIADGLAIAGIARGAIDVSDGLARDVGHVAAASRVRAVLESAALRAHLDREPALASVAALLRVAPIDLALHGGEDYAIVAASDAPLSPPFARIGRFEAGEGVALDEAGETRAIEARGFDHFR